MTDYADTLRNAQRANMPPGTADASALAPIEFPLTIPVAASADASTALAVGTPVAMPTQAEIVGAYFASAVSGAADSISYASVNLYAGASVAATFANSLAALVSTAGNQLTVATSYARAAAGTFLRVGIAKAEGGLSTGAGTLTVLCRRY